MATNFQHQPLNHSEPSIRLLRVLPDSPPDTIHCELQHTTVDASFVCLSYVWGAPDNRHKILVNNAEFWVWPNLWNFLCVAKEKYPLTAFWIDAICIDQNSIRERNHQVSLMGNIYSQAERVIVWLGCCERMVAFASAWSQRWTSWDNSPSDFQYRHGPSIAMRAWKALSIMERSGGYKLVTNEYWSRAWITQEVELPSHLELLVGKVMLDCKAVEALRGIGDPLRDMIFQTYMDTITGRGKLKGESLVNIFYALPDRHCKLRRDRVYSILSLASEGSKIAVDYGSSDLAVYSQVMQSCEGSMCICSAGVIARNLAWKSPLYPSLEKGVAKLMMYTYAKANNSQLNGFAALLCDACNEYRPFPCPSGSGHLFCLENVCSSIVGFHLWLSTAAPTEGRIFATRSDLSSRSEDVGNGVSIKKVTGSLFVIELDALGDFCKMISQSDRGDIKAIPLVLCEKAQYGHSEFTVRPLSPSKDGPNPADSQPGWPVVINDPVSDHTTVEGENTGGLLDCPELDLPSDKPSRPLLSLELGQGVHGTNIRLRNRRKRKWEEMMTQ